MRSSPSRVSVTALTLSINGVFALDPGFLYGGGGGAYIAVPLSILLSLLISRAFLKLIPDRRRPPAALRVLLCLGLAAFPALALRTFLHALQTLVYDAGAVGLLAFILPAVLYIALRGDEVAAWTSRCFALALVLSLAVSVAFSASGFQTYRLYPLPTGNIPYLVGLTLLCTPAFVPPLLAAGLAEGEARTPTVSALISCAVTGAALFASALCFPAQMLENMPMPLYAAGALDPRQSFILRLDKLFIMLWLSGDMIALAHALALGARLLKAGKSEVRA